MIRFGLHIEVIAVQRRLFHLIGMALLQQVIGLAIQGAGGVF